MCECCRLVLSAGVFVDSAVCCRTEDEVLQCLAASSPQASYSLCEPVVHMIRQGDCRWVGRQEPGPSACSNECPQTRYCVTCSAVWKRRAFGRKAFSKEATCNSAQSRLSEQLRSYMDDLKHTTAEIKSHGRIHSTRPRQFCSACRASNSIRRSTSGA